MSEHTPGPQASARSNPPHGYKALVVHANARTEVLARRGHRGVGKNFSSRDDAIAFAAATIEHRREFRAIRRYQFDEAHRTGRRPTEEEARAAIAKEEINDGRAVA